MKFNTGPSWIALIIHILINSVSVIVFYNLLGIEGVVGYFVIIISMCQAHIGKLVLFAKGELE
jgi:fumarate reductase subunit D